MLKVRRFLLLCLVALLVILPMVASAQETGPIYIVQAGDSLSAIARRFGISQQALVQANNISDPSRLFPGDVLLLPGFPGIEGELTLRPLELGESLPGLSGEYGLDALALARLNRMVRMDIAYAGQVLIVPAAAEATGLEELHLPVPVQGETLLELSVRSGVSPWDRLQPDGEIGNKWLLPGRSPASDRALSASRTPSPFSALRLEPSTLIQGNTAMLQVQALEGYTASGRLGERSLEFFPDGEGSLVALQGIHALEPPGLLDLSIVYSSVETGSVVYGFEQRVLIADGNYGFRVLNGVPPETIDPGITRPEDELIQQVLDPKSETKLWDGPFEYPSRYYTEEFVALFGIRRSYNQGVLLYYHTGLDFYGQDVPIYAPADGIVVFADSLTVRGNATYIDHGWGVYSGYLHQSEINVAVGDRVEKGQIIGQVGATGRVTGPHLHWEIWVGGVPVEPLDWVREQMPYR